MPAALQSSLVVAFSHRNRSQPAPRGVNPGNCDAFRSDNGAAGRGVCAALTCDVAYGSAAAPAVATTDFMKPRRDSLFTSATTCSSCSGESHGQPSGPWGPENFQEFDDRPDLVPRELALESRHVIHLGAQLNGVAI